MTYNLIDLDKEYKRLITKYGIRSTFDVLDENLDENLYENLYEINVKYTIMISLFLPIFVIFLLYISYN